MAKTTPNLKSVLETLSAAARRRGLNDSAWAAAAGVRKETLSRLRSRHTCDFVTVEALAKAVGARLDVLNLEAPQATADGHFPAKLDRDYEQRLLELAASPVFDPKQWASNGPAFFMAGLAVMLASVRGFDRHGLLALAERLHPGSSQAEVFSQWLARSPVRASRFLPLLKERLQRAA